ncbi:MAG: hypothetical protein WC208_15170 [Gallionella sp.]|jgi:hypothetical protein
MYQGECGSQFKYTHDRIDYHGSFSPENETGFLGLLLTSKPQLLEMAITNKDYKLTTVGEDVMMSLELKSVFETITIRLKRDNEVIQLKGRVCELEKEVGELTEKMKVKGDDMKERVEMVESLARKMVESLVGEMVEALKGDVKQLKGKTREMFGLLVREREDREGSVRELEKEMRELTKTVMGGGMKVESEEMKYYKMLGEELREKLVSTAHRKIIPY